MRRLTALKAAMRGNRQHWNRRLPVQVASRNTVAARTVWTDYPFKELGDTPGELAPIRPTRIVWYDGNKYVRLIVSGQEVETKSCYVYRRPGRLGDGIAKRVPSHWLKAMEST